MAAISKRTKRGTWGKQLVSTPLDIIGGGVDPVTKERKRVACNVGNYVLELDRADVLALAAWIERKD